MKKTLALILALCMVLALAACGSSNAPAANTPAADTPADAPAAENKNILWLETHNNNSFMSYLGELTVVKLEEAGYTVDFLTAGGDEATQLSQIEQGVSSGKYFALICDCTGPGVSEGFKQAKEAGMIVITMHEGIVDNTYVDAHVACSLAETGYQHIALEVAELGDSFNLAIVNGTIGSGAQVAIREGYDRALAEFPNLNVVFDGEGHWNAEDAMTLVESWFSSGTKIDGIVCMNDGMATGVRQVMKDNGVLGTIPIYSNDCEIDTLAAVEAGEQSGSFDMNAEAQIAKTLEVLEKLMAGETFEGDGKIFLVDPLLVTKDNLEEYRANHASDY